MAEIRIKDLELTTVADDESIIAIDNGEVTYGITVADFNSNANATALSYANAAGQSATAAASSATAAQGYAGDAQTQATAAETSAFNAASSASSASSAVTSAQGYASNASGYATNASASATSAARHASDAEESQTLAQSWAVGNTGSRTGEDTNNAMYWASIASAAVLGDYNAAMIPIEDTSDLLGGNTTTVQLLTDEIAARVTGDYTEKGELQNNGLTTVTGQYALDAAYGKTLRDNDDSLAKDISKNADNILANSANISINAANITSLDGRITANANNIAINTADIAANTDEINTSKTQITVNKNNIETNKTNIAANTTAISQNSASINTLNTRVTQVANGGTGQSTLTTNAVLSGNATGAVKMIATNNGAAYATSENGALTFGKLPVAQGGTGQTTFTANSVLIGNGTSGIANAAAASGALFATGNTKPKFGVLPIAQGGTGQTSIAKIKEALGIDQTTTTTVTTLGSSFKAYNDTNSNLPTFVKRNGVVSMRGILSPRSELAAGSSSTMFTVPSGYRPSIVQYFMCQGSNENIWLLSVATNGTATFQRYRNGGTGAACPTGAWLPFSGTWVSA